jgi:hypothetical protein
MPSVSKHLRRLVSEAELRVPHRVREDLENVARWSADPPGYGDRLAFVVGHLRASLSGRSPLTSGAFAMMIRKTHRRATIHRYVRRMKAGSLRPEQNLLVWA